MTGTAPEANLSNLLHETRRFDPPPKLAAEAIAKKEIYAEAAKDPLAFWEKQANRLTWAQPWSQVLDWSDAPFSKWFVGAKLNVAVNCLDRHVEAGHGDQVAYHWEGEPGDTRTITYAELTTLVCKAANALTELGVVAGDRVMIYMPMIPETVVSMLACARIGAPHSVVFGGFSAEALAGRTNDCEAKFIITADGGYRRGAASALKPAVDLALKECPQVETVVVVRRTGQDVEWYEGRDVWWHDVVDKQPETHAAQAFDAEQPLYIMYTSGTTAKPKGILHTSGGYLTGVSATHKMVFDLHEDTDVYWCAADIGWVTGHSYIVYGPLANGATTLMFEGVPNYPGVSRFWEVIDKHKVSIFYTAPTAIRSLMAAGEGPVMATSRASLRLLGSVGEPINPEAWEWYHRVVGEGRCPIVDTWWQTETGGILISPLPGATDLKPGSATKPFFGVAPEIVDASGEVLEGACEGNLVIADSWPGQARTVFGDHERFVQTYFTAYPGKYFTGDGARRDADGYYWITGRVDDVLNVSGHRLGTAEIESALVAHARVSEAAVVGYPHDIKGQGVWAYVTPMQGVVADEELRRELVKFVREEIGPIATPDVIQFAPGLPKTRSGKIMRRILRKIAEGDVSSLGDTSTLADPAVVEELVKGRGG